MSAGNEVRGQCFQLKKEQSISRNTKSANDVGGHIDTYSGDPASQYLTKTVSH